MTYQWTDAAALDAIPPDDVIGVDVQGHALALYRVGDEVFATDVKCTHGSATGRLDADALFYLRSRGFSVEQAQSVLTLAFASEIVDRVPLEPLKAHVSARVLGWLGGNAPEAR